LAKLGLDDRSDPTTLTLAKLIIELAKAGERLSIEALVRVGGLSFETAPAAGMARHLTFAKIAS